MLMPVVLGVETLDHGLDASGELGVRRDDFMDKRLGDVARKSFGQLQHDVSDHTVRHHHIGITIEDPTAFDVSGEV